MTRTRKIVLIVEDDDDLRHLFRDALRWAGFDVCEASDGVLALRCIEDAVPDVVVLDIGLPMLDGLSLREEIDRPYKKRAVSRSLPSQALESMWHVSVRRASCASR